jgi:hypothetical protein
MSVIPSVRMELLCSHWKDLNEILYLNIFENLSRNFRFHCNMTSITGRLDEGHCTFTWSVNKVMRLIQYNSAFIFKLQIEIVPFKIVPFGGYLSHILYSLLISHIILQNGTGHRRRYGACALHVA